MKAVCNASFSLRANVSVTFPEDAIDSAVAFVRKKFEVARTGEGWEQFQSLLNRAQQEKWFRFVNAPRSLDRLVEAWRGQFAYDPEPDLRKLRNSRPRTVWRTRHRNARQANC